MLDHGMYYVDGKSWHDVFDTIRATHRLVYIMGWLLWHKVRLGRDDGIATNFTLGELLRAKSSKGVRVLLPVFMFIHGYKMVCNVSFVLLIMYLCLGRIWRVFGLLFAFIPSQLNRKVCVTMN